jgi:hypothetical protein
LWSHSSYQYQHFNRISLLCNRREVQMYGTS